MKKCRLCGESKPLSDFYAMAGMKDGYRNDCNPALFAAAARYLERRPLTLGAGDREKRPPRPRRKVSL